jgi:hypothetical protein
MKRINFKINVDFAPLLQESQGTKTIDGFMKVTMSLSNKCIHLNTHMYVNTCKYTSHSHILFCKAVIFIVVHS